MHIVHYVCACTSLYSVTMTMVVGIEMCTTECCSSQHDKNVHPLQATLHWQRTFVPGRSGSLSVIELIVCSSMILGSSHSKNGGCVIDFFGSCLWWNSCQSLIVNGILGKACHVCICSRVSLVCSTRCLILVVGQLTHSPYAR